MERGRVIVARAMRLTGTAVGRVPRAVGLTRPAERLTRRPVWLATRERQRMPSAEHPTRMGRLMPLTEYLAHGPA